MFEVLRSAVPHANASVVFVTAHEHYAVQAFDIDAVGYLMKPVTSERIAATLERVRARRLSRKSDMSELLLAVMELERRQRALEQAVAAEGREGSASSWCAIGARSSLCRCAKSGASRQKGTTSWCAPPAGTI